MNSSSHHYIHWFQRDIAASSATNWWVIDIQRYSSKNLHGKWKSSEPKLHEFGFQQVAFECVKLSFWETRPKDPDTRSPWLDRGWWDIPDYTGPGHMIYRFIYNIYRAFEDARSAAASREQKQPKQRRIQRPSRRDLDHPKDAGCCGGVLSSCAPSWSDSTASYTTQARICYCSFGQHHLETRPH